MEYMGTVFVYVDAVHLFRIATSAYMLISVNDKTFPAILMSPVGKHAAKQTGTHYQIIVLFHNPLFYMFV
jgi:hypothetical protein